MVPCAVGITAHGYHITWVLKHHGITCHWYQNRLVVLLIEIVMICIIVGQLGFMNSVQWNIPLSVVYKRTNGVYAYEKLAVDQ